MDDDNNGSIDIDELKGGFSQSMSFYHTQNEL